MNRQQRRRAAQKNKKLTKAKENQRIESAKKKHNDGQWDEAEALYELLLTDYPRHPEVLHYSGLLAFQRGRNEEALKLIGKSITINSRSPIYIGNYANVLFQLGDFEAAETYFRKAIKLDPNYITAYRNFAALLANLNRIEEAERAVRQALELKPEDVEALTNLGLVLQRLGNHDEAEKTFRKALRINPNFERAHSSLIFSLDFNPAKTFTEQQDERRLWAERFADPLTPSSPTYSVLPDPDRKLRIGYVSGDFRQHSAAIAFGPAIFNRDPKNFEVFCYTTSAQRDFITQQFEDSADSWRPCWTKLDHEIAKMVEEDAIDILVDLSGHSAGNRLLAFARKPAPIMISAWGHCTGTGLKAMDYIFSDRITIPLEHAAKLSEKVVELSCALCYAPPADAPAVTPLPALINNHITFGCLNRFEKISDEALSTWSTILRRVPGSKLLLKAVAFDEPNTVKKFEARLRDHGIERHKVKLRGRTPWLEHIETCSEFDIALDTFPNNGGVTTLEMLWMGVPVITLEGKGAANRISSAIVTASGHPEWASLSLGDYINRVVELAERPANLEWLRNTLRKTVSQKPLANASLYAREVEGQYRRLWREWVAQKKADLDALTPKQSEEPQSPSAAQIIPENIDSIVKKAAVLHGAGKFSEAIALYDEVLAAFPDNWELLHLKGVAMAQSGNLDQGIEFLRAAAKLNEKSFDIFNNLGSLLFQSGRLGEADHALRHAIKILPTHATAHNNLGEVLEQSGRLEEALAAYQTAAKLEPSNSAIHCNIGIIFQRLECFEDSCTALHRAVELDPSSPKARNNLGNAMRGIGDLEGAATELRRAIDLNPDYANAHQNLGSVLTELMKINEAITSFKQALTLAPNHPQALVNLAAALNLKECLEESEIFARQAIAIAPDLAEAHNNLGVSLRGQGKYNEAEACYKKVVELDPNHATGHSNLIFALDFNSAYSVKDHQEERARWRKIHTEALAANIKPNKNDPDPDRVLRIGYVSADFRRHSAANCFGPMLLSFDRTQFAVYCYSSNLEQDEITEMFRSAATVWRECRRMTDAQLAEKIQEDKIDILIDLSGHSAGNRMLAFARKPAPVQATAWGHGCGTGLTTIDYFLTDPIIVPDAEKTLYAETIRYLPSHIHYMPPKAAPEITNAPHLENDFITFGSFNRLEKISDDSLKLWSRILREIDDAHLVIKSQTLDRVGVKSDFEHRLEDAALPTNRITLLGSDPHHRHLAKHGLVDIMLDPFPHGGGISTSDALWMGVPIITLAGNTVPGRLTASILNAIGLPELEANSQDQYVEIASQLGRNSDLIVTLRHSMRDRVKLSPVGDPNQYVCAVETLYREFWREWCASQ